MTTKWAMTQVGNCTWKSLAGDTCDRAIGLNAQGQQVSDNFCEFHSADPQKTVAFLTGALELMKAKGRFSCVGWVFPGDVDLGV